VPFEFDVLRPYKKGTKAGSKKAAALVEWKWEEQRERVMHTMSGRAWATDSCHVINSVVIPSFLELTGIIWRGRT